jgi:spore germination cell wall hydrolase CwlJ-like protein
VLILGTAVAYAAFTPYTDQMPGRHVASEVSQPMKPQFVAANPAPSEVAMAQLLAERRCLAQAMYYEARGEGVRGEKAVAEVVFHRMRSRIYPATICGVVFQGAEEKIACQFSFVCNGDMDKPIEKHAWAEARLLAAKIMTGAMPLGDITDDATSYHAVSVDPVWAAHLVRTVQIGNHIFYRRPATRSRPM